MPVSNKAHDAITNKIKEDMTVQELIMNTESECKKEACIEDHKKWELTNGI